MKQGPVDLFDCHFCGKGEEVWVRLNFLVAPFFLVELKGGPFFVVEFEVCFQVFGTCRNHVCPFFVGGLEPETKEQTETFELNISKPSQQWLENHHLIFEQCFLPIRLVFNLHKTKRTMVSIELGGTFLFKVYPQSSQLFSSIIVCSQLGGSFQDGRMDTW